MEEQIALEGINGHGAFTEALLQALVNADGDSGDGDGFTSFLEIAHYVDKRVPQTTMEECGYAQIPQIFLVGRDVPLGKVRVPVECVSPLVATSGPRERRWGRQRPALAQRDGAGPGTFARQTHDIECR